MSTPSGCMTVTVTVSRAQRVTLLGLLLRSLSLCPMVWILRYLLWMSRGSPHPVRLLRLLRSKLPGGWDLSRLHPLISFAP